MKKNKQNMNIKTIQIFSNKFSQRNKTSKDKKSFLNNPFILQLLDKEFKNKKSQLYNKKLTPNFSYKNNPKRNSNIRNSEINSIKTKNGSKHQIDIRLNLNHEIINNNYVNTKKPKHHSLDQIYLEDIQSVLKKKNNQIIQLQKALIESENLLNKLQKNNNKSTSQKQLKNTLIKNNSKKILNLKISKKHNLTPTFNSMTTTNSNYISNDQNYSSFVSNATSPRKKVVSNRYFSTTVQNNINFNYLNDEVNLSNSNFTPELKKNKYIFTNKINNENIPTKVIINSKISNNSNFDIRNNLEELKKKTKKVLNSYLTYINMNNDN